MTSANTNYGVTLGKQDSVGYTSIGEIVNVDPPAYLNPAVEATNHGGGGVREFVTGGLREMGEFKATINHVNANIATLVTDLAAGTKGVYRLGFPTGNHMDFSAIVTGIKPLAADAKSPDVLQSEITFRPSDSLAFSS